MKFVLVIALLAVPAAAFIQLTPAKITVSGKVKVHGQPVNPDTYIYTGAELETGKGSSALVSLGQLGSIEIKENSDTRLDFNEVRFAVSLFGSGSLKVATKAGVSATVRTADVQVAVDHTKANEFTIEATCGKVVVSALSGRVLLATGGSKLTVKEILGGATESVDTPRSSGCK
jgi:ferric-dicitrate binding protein FerR (iron transport regulator)